MVKTCVSNSQWILKLHDHTHKNLKACHKEILPEKSLPNYPNYTQMSIIIIIDIIINIVIIIIIIDITITIIIIDAHSLHI